MAVSNNQNGQSFFEVIVAVGIISIVMITLVALASASIRASTFSRNQTEASRFTEQAAEWLREEKDASWTTFNTYAATKNWCLDSLYWQKPRTCNAQDVISGTVFTRSLKFTVNADTSIEADVQTAWTDGQGTHTAQTSIIFTNWK